MLSKSVALVSMVALLFPMLFFMLATPPLLVLKHDTPQDPWVNRGLFNYYYKLAAPL